MNELNVYEKGFPQKRVFINGVYIDSNFHFADFYTEDDMIYHIYNKSAVKLAIQIERYGIFPVYVEITEEPKLVLTAKTVNTQRNETTNWWNLLSERTAPVIVKRGYIEENSKNRYYAVFVDLRNRRWISYNPIAIYLAETANWTDNPQYYLTVSNTGKTEKFNFERI